MRGRCARGLFGDGQSKTFSEILEENKGRNPTGVCQSCGASFSKVADCSTARIKCWLDPKMLAAAIRVAVGTQVARRPRLQFPARTGREAHAIVRQPFIPRAGTPICSAQFSAESSAMGRRLLEVRFAPKDSGDGSNAGTLSTRHFSQTS